MSDTQENIKLVEMMKTLQGLKMKLSKETDMQKWTQVEVKTDLKDPVTQVEN